MNEAEWLNSTSPAAMLAHVPAKVSDRRLRLFAVACCRQVWGHLADPRSRKAVEVAEQYADGLATGEDILCAGGHAGMVPRDDDNEPAVMMATAIGQLIVDAAGCVVQVLGWSNPFKQHATQAALLRDIVGNPFRPLPYRWVDGELNEVSYAHHGMAILPVAYYDALPWLTWNDGTVSRLAEEAYRERLEEVCGRCDGNGKMRYPDMEDDEPDRECPTCHGARRIPTGHLDPDRLAVLADALTDAGCEDQAILRHLRGYKRCTDCLEDFEDHEWCTYCGKERWVEDWWRRTPSPTPPLRVRGDWAIDLLTGRS